jgi:hypothetical protein
MAGHLVFLFFFLSAYVGNGHSIHLLVLGVILVSRYLSEFKTFCSTELGREKE